MGVISDLFKYENSVAFRIGVIQWVSRLVLHANPTG